MVKQDDSEISSTKDRHQGKDEEAILKSQQYLSRTAEEEKHQQRQVQHLDTARKMLFVFTALYTFFFAGAFYGWGPMQLLLEEDGAFSWKCNASNATSATALENDDFDDVVEVCPAQTKTLLNVQFIAITISLAFAPALGHLADKFGVQHMMTFTAVICCTGVSLLMIASATHTDRLLFIAFLCLGFMVSNTSVLIVKTGLVFERSESQQRVISALNTLFDAGSITYLGLWNIGNSNLFQNQYYDNKLVTLAGGYLVLAIICFGGAWYYWKRIGILLPKNSLQEPEQQEEIESGMSPTEVDLTTDGQSRMDNTDQNHKRRSSDPENHPESTGIQNCESNNIDRMNIGPSVLSTPSQTAVQEVSDGADDGSSHFDKDYIKISERTSSEQLRSSQFLYLVVFFSIHVARNIFNLTTARDFLADLGDDDKGNKYLSIFTLLLPVSVIGLPFVDCVLQSSRQGVTTGGFYDGLQSINLLALCHGIIQTSNDNLNVQIVGFVLFSFYRCFLFAVTFSFLPVFLSSKVMGKATGILIFAAGTATIINIPLSNIAVTYLDGDFFWPNLFFTILVVPCIYVAWQMGQGIQRENEAK